MSSSEINKPLKNIQKICSIHKEIMIKDKCLECQMEKYFKEQERKVVESGLTYEELEEQAWEKYIETNDWVYDQYPKLNHF